MKTSRKNELNVDFIGCQSPLTKVEEKAINEYFINKLKNKTHKSPLAKRSKIAERDKNHQKPLASI